MSVYNYDQSKTYFSIVVQYTVKKLNTNQINTENI